MRRLLVCLALLAAGLTAPSAGALQSTGTPVPIGLQGNAEAGTLGYTHGLAVWTDYAYDDRGTAYPAEVTNEGDLVQLLFLPRRDGRLDITATLETLTASSRPVLGIAFDIDRRRTTGAAAVPGSWHPKGGLGVEALVTVSEHGAQLKTWDHGAWRAVRRLHSELEVNGNDLEVHLPRGVVPRRGPIRAYAVLGVADAHGDSWLTGKGAVSDLGFVGGEDFRGWQNARQQQVIAGTLDASVAAGNIDLDLARRRVTRFPALTPGAHGLLYRSNLELKEGVAPYRTDVLESQGGDTFLGPYQPYSVWIPKHVATPTPLLVFLHGFGGNHLEDPRFFGPGGFDPQAVTVMPLARGDGFYYAGIGEQDVYDVEADIRRRYTVDDDRVYLSGISMGGMGTFRLAQLHPDHWAGVAPIINMSSMPLPEEQGAAEHRLLPAELENLTALPVRMVNGRLDPLANVNPDKDVAELTARGIDFRYWDLVKRQHEVVAPMQACVVADAMSHVRVRNPAHVVFSRQPSMETAQVTGGIARRYDSAYWVSGLTMRGPAVAFDDKATVDVTSSGLPMRSDSTALVTGFGQNITAPGDPCGTPHSTAKTDDVWYEVGQRVTRSRAAVSNVVTVRITRVGDVTFDMRRMALSTATPLTVTVTGDGRSTIRLRGPWRRLPKVAGPSGVTASLAGGTLALTGDFTGATTLTVAP
jgi:pimeloyl-ACP methyl ester carboxylesterase